MIWNSKTLAEALSQEVPEGIIGGRIIFNSKDISKGDIFLALSGGARDGHDFIADALEQGASAIIARYVPTALADANKIILVSDTYYALLELARYKRAKSSAYFIGITGSVGKTSTKEALLKVMSQYGKTYANVGNYNNHIGVPLSLASMPDDVDYAIIEMGMNHSSEISGLSKLVKPHFAIITTIAEVHIANFANFEELIAAKCEIFEGLQPKGSVAIHQGDRIYKSQISHLTNYDVDKIYNFGTHNDSIVKLCDFQQNSVEAIAHYKIKGQMVQVRSSNLTSNLAHNYMPIFALCYHLQKPLEVVAQELSLNKPLFGRGNILSLCYNNINFKIIHDCYNASPIATRAAIFELGKVHHDAKRKIVCLADMFELGEPSKQIHQSLLVDLKEANIDKVICVGEHIQSLWEVLPPEMALANFTSYKMFEQNWQDFFEDGDIILFKGSHGTNLYKVVEKIIQNSEEDNVI